MSLSESRRRRSALSVRFGYEELDRLQAEADARGVSVGSLVRGRALGIEQPPANGRYYARWIEASSQQVARCNCGWTGQARDTTEAATADLAGHPPH